MSKIELFLEENKSKSSFSDILTSVFLISMILGSLAFVVLATPKEARHHCIVTKGELEVFNGTCHGIDLKSEGNFSVVTVRGTGGQVLLSFSTLEKVGYFIK